MTHTLSITEADDVLPSSRNHGLKPSDDFLFMMRRCWTTTITSQRVSMNGWRVAYLREIANNESQQQQRREDAREGIVLLTTVNEHITESPAQRTTWHFP